MKINEPVTFIMQSVGPFCNLGCSYCFFHNNVDQLTPRLMSDTILSRFIQEYLSYTVHNSFIWHGGEPLLAGLRFYKSAIDLQNKFRSDENEITNGLQTNLTLVNQEWARFFYEHDFLLSTSIDGPESIHNAQRSRVGGQGSFNATLRGLEILRSEGVEPGVISVITKQSLPYLREILAFLHEELGFKRIALNAMISDGTLQSDIMQMNNYEYQKLLTVCFDYWLERDDPDFSIRDVDNFIAGVLKKPSKTCAFSGRCHQFLSIDDQGQIYPCERLRSDPGWLYGNIMQNTLDEILQGSYRSFFVSQQKQSLPSDCLECEWLENCYNGCTHIREELSPLNMQGKYIYCSTQKYMFNYAREKIGQLIPLVPIASISTHESIVPVL